MKNPNIQNKLEAKRPAHEILEFCLEQQGEDQEYLSRGCEMESSGYSKIVSGRDDALQQVIEFISGEDKIITEHL